MVSRKDWPQWDSFPGPINAQLSLVVKWAFRFHETLIFAIYSSTYFLTNSMSDRPGERISLILWFFSTSEETFGRRKAILFSLERALILRDRLE